MSLSELLIPSARLDEKESGILVQVTPQEANWKLIHFLVRQLAAGHSCAGQTGDQETGLILLKGECTVTWETGEAKLGPRADVFESYPHALYLPPESNYMIEADRLCEIAEGRTPARRHLEPRVIRPEDCGFEIRGGGNATRQIVDIMPPDFPADRLLVCEVFTPSGNWSSYPPHKHDTDNPPAEVKLEETYYYRYREPEAYGIQRLYTADGRIDEVMRVVDGDLVLIREGYHPFVSAYGYDAYYLNVLAGDRRSMAASDDPQHVRFRHDWPPRDPRLPLLEKPAEKCALESK